MNYPRQLKQYPIAPSDPTQQPMAVDSGYTFPSSSRSEEDVDVFPSTNGMARASSTRQRTDGKGQVAGVSQLPPAPDVPKGPPLSYRSPYTNDETIPVPQTDKSSSFAARAHASQKDIGTGNEGAALNGIAAIQKSTSGRRSSVKRPSGTIYDPIEPYTNVKLQIADTEPRLREDLDDADSSKPLRTRVTTQTKSVSQGNTPVRQEVDEALLSRSDTKRTLAAGKESRKAWAADRSPLQKLEVKLNDISKEEKRARVQEAEQLLRERLANQARGDVSQKPEITVKAAQPKRLSLAPEDSRRGDVEQHSPRHVPGEMYTQIREAGTKYPRAKRDSINNNDLSTSHYGLQIPEGAQSPQTAYQPTPRETSATNQPRLHHGPSPEIPRLTKQPERGVRFQNHGYTNGTDEEPTSPNDPSIGQESFYSQKTLEMQLNSQSGAQIQTNSNQRNYIPRLAQPAEGFSEQRDAVYSGDNSNTGQSTERRYDVAFDPQQQNATRSQPSAFNREVPSNAIANSKAGRQAAVNYPKTETVAKPTQREPHLSGVPYQTGKAVSVDSRGISTRDSNVRKDTRVAPPALADSSLEPTTFQEQKAWWEGGGSASRRRSGRSTNDSEMHMRNLNGGTEIDNGLRRSRNLNHAGLGNASTSVERETWRGSVMIVTLDASSSYNPAPVLQIYKEPISPVPAEPQTKDEGSGANTPPEYIDPIGGMPKLSRTGKMVYVKPVEDLEGGKDLSQFDDDEGLFEEFRTAAVPTAYGIPPRPPGRGVIGGRDDQNGSLSHGQSHIVQAIRLHAERGVTFWRFNLEVELGGKQERFGYRINKSASVGFWVPALGQSMNVMFHSCNGFSMSVNPDDFSGPDPLWRDVLNTHQTRPFHAMIGGGDQIYNDAVMKKTTHFREWLSLKNPHHKHEAEFSIQMREEVETFYLQQYSKWFSQGLFGMANSQIPMINIWDDHDIIDGFGSYPDHFMRAPVFCGLGAVAFKYYMLFQHQSVVAETHADEPSWLLGAAPGPYIKEYSRSVFMFLGRSVALLGLDCRTERRRDEVMSEASYRLVFDRCRREIIEGETKHLIVLLGVPIAYPRLVFLENILTSRVMDPIKALGRAGMFGGFLNQFDGGVEILDDLDDHWTAKNHKDERNWLIQELQELAAEKSVRVTILGGDVHLAAVGRFFSNAALQIPKDHDHRYMANIISSAIVNTPPPEMMGDILNKRNKVHHLDVETDEDMIPMFTHDVDGKPRKNRHLLPRRNWCSIREYYPGSTPTPTPPPSEPTSPVQDSPRPASRLQRRFSLTKSDSKTSKPGGLLRRLSQRNESSREYVPSQRNASNDSTIPYDLANDGVTAASEKPSSPPQRPSVFHRRLTDMDNQTLERGNVKGGDALAGHVNLEYGLDIILNCEINQKDPGGNTEPYRLLIPALWYEGEGDLNTLEHKKIPLLKRLGSKRGSKRKSGLARGQGRGEWGGGSLSGDSEGERPRTAVSARNASVGGPRFSDSNVNNAERQVPHHQGNDVVLASRIPPGQSKMDMLRGGDYPNANNASQNVPRATDSIPTAGIPPGQSKINALRLPGTNDSTPMLSGGAGAVLTGRIPPGQSKIDTLRGGKHPTAINSSPIVPRGNTYDPARKQNEFEQASGVAPESGVNGNLPQRPSQTDRIMRANYAAGGEPEYMSGESSEIEYEKPRTRNKIVRMLSGGKPSNDRRNDSPEYDSEIEYEKPRKQSKLARMLGAREPADDLSDDDGHYVQPRTRRMSTLERIMSSGGRKNEESRYDDGQGGTQGSPSTPKGYSGIEAYPGKGWKRFF